ncbi:MAG: hypothetical protein EAZ97_04065 [Bacteroidetes bacterium]|nr:MAG: hypothetical protein EAZ97_04065 [Bacteroidota bacterium]
MVLGINILSAAFVWLLIFLFAKFNFGVTSNDILTTSLVALGIVVVYSALNTFRQNLKYNIGIHAFVLLINIAVLFILDYFIVDFTINSTAIGVLLGLLIAGVFLLGAFGRKAIIGGRGQL